MTWDEPDLQRLTEEDWKVHCDMCMFGMNVNGEGLNRKPTSLLTNSKCIAEEMDRRCDHTHEHVPTLSGLPLKAQVYPKEFCKAILKALKNQILQDDHKQVGNKVWMIEDFVEQDEEADMEDDLEKELAASGLGIPSAFNPQRGEEPGICEITSQEKNAVAKLHRSVGHPTKAEMIRFMRAARVRGDVIKWTQQKFECDICKAKAQPQIGQTHCNTKVLSA